MSDTKEKLERRLHKTQLVLKAKKKSLATTRNKLAARIAEANIPVLENRVEELMRALAAAKPADKRSHQSYARLSPLTSCFRSHERYSATVPGGGTLELPAFLKRMK